MTEPENIRPFGFHPLSGWETSVIAVTRAMPQGWAGKRLALLLRKLVKSAMSRPVDVEVFGLKMRLNGTRNIAERRLLIQPQHFDPAERDMLRAHLRPGGLAVDIGANVGAYTLFMAGLVGPHGRVLAVEPQPSVLARLRENLSLNPELTVTVAAVALGDKAGEALFQPGGGNEGEGKLAKEGASDGIPVRVETLTHLLAAQSFDRIDALKIDVEGWEPQVLTPFFETAPRTLWPGLIVIERGNERWSVDMIAWLKERGYVDKAGSRLNAVLALA
jgi:FkbM family methyltransferase